MSEMILLGVLVVASVGLIIYSLWPTKKADSDHMRRRMAGRRLEQAEALLAAAPKRERSTAKEMIEKVAPIAMRPVMPASEEEMTKLRGKLSQAGYRSEAAVRYFLATSSASVSCCRTCGCRLPRAPARKRFATVFRTCWT